MDRVHLRLHPTEAAITTAAAEIYAAYVAAGRVPDGDEAAWRDRAVEEAIALARAVDERIVGENEVG